MAYPQGIDFRSTSGYVTDPTNCNVEVDNSGTPTYPRTTTQGNTVGWETTGLQGRNRNSGNDARIAGMHFGVGNANCDFRMDLPATGSYLISLAVGDPNYACNVLVDLIDTSASLGSLSTGATSAAQRFKDAINTEYTQTTWPTSQTPVSKTFATTICRFRVKPSAGTDSRICHVFVQAAAGTLLPAPYIKSQAVNTAATY
jgi:hypothetical protein